MTDKLKDRVVEIISQEMQSNPPGGYIFIEDMATRIDQAYKDAGYRHNLAAGYWKREAEREGMMTGQEWYERFETNLRKHFDLEADEDWPKYLDAFSVDDFLVEAKKAAGLES